jgi:hypothetical protein
VKIPALQSDSYVREAHITLRERLSIHQIQFIFASLRGFLGGYGVVTREERRGSIEWDAWSAFICAAYSSGFVCPDTGEEMDGPDRSLVAGLICRLEADLGRLEGRSLCD